MVIFSEQFGTLINSGIPIIRSLELLSKQTTNVRLKRVIADVSREVEKGTLLSKALARYPDVFSRFYTDLVKAGEISGKFDEILLRLAYYLDKRQALRQAIKSAFTYPVIVLVISFVAVSFLLGYVVPIFNEVYSKMSMELPLVTVVLIKISEIFGAYWKHIFLIIILTGLSYPYLSKKTSIRRFIDSAKINMPLFGKLYREIIMTRFARTLATLTSSGIPILKSLRLLSETGENLIFNQILKDIYQQIRDGASMSESIAVYSIFPPIVVQMVATAEETGRLEEMMNKAADFMERSTDHTVKRLVVMIEPLLTVALGFIVFFIALSIYLPIFDLIKMAKK